MVDQAVSPDASRYAGVELPRRGVWTVVGIFCRLAVGGLFIYAALTKIADPDKFVKEVRQYQMVQVEASNALAYVLPWVELLAGGLLVLGVWRGEMRLVVFAMLAAFVIAKGYVLAQGRHIECGCVPSTSPIAFLFEGPWGIVLNIGLMALLALDGIAQRRVRARHVHDRTPA